MRFTQVDPAKEIRSRINPFEALSFDPEDLALVRPNGEEESLVALLAKLGDGDVSADVNSGLELHAQVPDDLNFGFDDVARQAIGRNAHGQHAAKHGKLFEDGYLITLDGKIIGTGKPGRPGTDDRHLFVTLHLDFRNIAGFGVEIEVGHEPLNEIYRHRFVHLPPRTNRFAGVIADPAADGRQADSAP